MLYRSAAPMKHIVRSCLIAAILAGCVAIAGLCEPSRVAARTFSPTPMLLQRSANKKARKKPAPERPTQQKTRSQDDPNDIRKMTSFLGRAFTVIKYIVIGAVALVLAFYLWFFLYDNVYKPVRTSEFVAGIRIRRSLKKMLEAEASALRARGILQPTQRTELFTRKDGIHAPTFEPPPHLLFKVRRLAELPLDDSYDASRYEGFTPHRVYFIADDSATLERTLEDFNSLRLHEVVKDNQGLWLNRDPYALHKFLNKQEPLSTSVFSEQLHRAVADRWRVNPNDPSTWPLPPLEEVEGIPAEKLHQITRRVFLFAAFTHGCIPLPPLSDLYVSEPLPNEIPDYVLSDLPLPQVSFPEEDFVTLKILPDSSSRPGLSLQFLESLRQASHPLAFEVIAQQGTMYLQLCYSSADRGVVEHQLETHFPAFAVLEGESVFTAPTPLHFCRALPSYPCRRIKTLSDFTLDPYGQLFSALNAADSNDTVCVQVVFSPLPSDAVTMITAYLTQYRDGYRPSRKERLLEQWDG